VILSIDPERERISLGVKQLESDPFSEYVAENDKGTLITGKVISVDAKAAVIEIAPGVEGVLKASDISRDKVEDARNVLNEGDSVEAVITAVDRKNRGISLSVKAKDSAEDKAALKEQRAKADAEMTGPTTIGDLIKEQLNQKD
jgi:small subunit ribosomal protein S1